MAELNNRKPENVAGRFYVDDTCIDCDLCRETAPGLFRRDDDTGQSYVYLQPSMLAEIGLAMDALAGCPTESIGDDGE